MTQFLRGPMEDDGDVTRSEVKLATDLSTVATFEQPQRNDRLLHSAKKVHAAEDHHPLLRSLEKLVGCGSVIRG